MEKDYATEERIKEKAFWLTLVGFIFVMVAVIIVALFI